MIETTRGPITANELGLTLMHEHMVMIDAYMQNTFSDWVDPDRIVDLAIPQLKKVREKGVCTIVDATPINLSRNVPLIARLSEASGVNLVVATGLYHHDYPLVNTPDPMWVKNLFLRELNDGCQGTGIKAGYIKCAAEQPIFSPTITNLLTAAAYAALESGAPIMAHSNSENENGIKEAELFRQLGMDLEKVMIAHVDSESIDYALRLLDSGVMIGYDRFGTLGLATMENRIQNLAELLRRGYASQIVLGHDSHIYEDFWRPWHTPQYEPQSEVSNFYHVTDRVIPRLLELGISQDTIDQMMIRNPIRFLDWRN